MATQEKAVELEIENGKIVVTEINGPKQSKALTKDEKDLITSSWEVDTSKVSGISGSAGALGLEVKSLFGAYKTASRRVYENLAKEGKACKAEGKATWLVQEDCISAARIAQEVLLTNLKAEVTNVINEGGGYGNWKRGINKARGKLSAVDFPESQDEFLGEFTCNITVRDETAESFDISNSTLNRPSGDKTPYQLASEFGEKFGDLGCENAACAMDIIAAEVAKLKRLLGESEAEVAKLKRDAETPRKEIEADADLEEMPA